jgi:hypothetical protein
MTKAPAQSPGGDLHACPATYCAGCPLPGHISRLPCGWCGAIGWPGSAPP